MSLICLHYLLRAKHLIVVHSEIMLFVTLASPLPTDFEYTRPFYRGNFKPSSFDITHLDESSPLAAAVDVVQCKACFALTTALWSGLVNWTLHHMQPIKADQIAQFATELCNEEVPVIVLREWVLLSASVVGQPEQPQQFYLLTPRHRQHAKTREIEAVREACKSLLSSGTQAGDPKITAAGTLANLAALKQASYLEAVRQTPAGSPDDVDPTATKDGIDDLSELRPQRLCYDKHPQCLLWVGKGECKNNPSYMIGTPESPGSCRLACGECTPQPLKLLPQGLSEEASKELAALSDRLLDDLQTRGCTKTPACRWDVSVDNGKHALSGATWLDPSHSAVLQQAAAISGPVTFQSTQSPTPASESGVDKQLLQQSTVVMARPAAHALVSGPKPTQVTLRRPKGRGALECERALWDSLGGQCIYATSGWWSYEVCYGVGVTQFHVNAAGGVPDWVISLGNFAKADWTVDVDEDVGLFAKVMTVPFIAHEYDNGNECELTGENGVNTLVPGGHHEEGTAHPGGLAPASIGSTVPRTTKMRFMCSPDDKAHIAVKEPMQCAYVVDVFLPQLCEVRGMAPVLKYRSAAGSNGPNEDGEEEDVEYDGMNEDPPTTSDEQGQGSEDTEPIDVLEYFKDEL